jgi:hypothetical protein
MSDSHIDVNAELKNPCVTRKNFCVNCHSHFMTVRPNLSDVVVSRRFFKDIKDREVAESIVKDILDCSNLDFSELHRFEMNVDGNMIFRAKKDRAHIVYCVDKKLRIIFLRAFKNYGEYKRFLEQGKEVKRMIERL